MSSDKVKDLCDRIATRFSLNSSELYDMWETQSDDSDTKVTKNKIMTATKDMLAAMCKKEGLKVSGKKEELMTRLIDHLEKAPTAVAAPVAAPAAPKKTAEDPPVIKKVKNIAGELAIRKNKFGNFEHMQSGLVFNTDKMVYGKQLEDGEIADLTAQDIETAKKYKFAFKLPENLNVNKNLEDVNIEELEEEEELNDDDIEDEAEDDIEDEVEDE